MNKELFEQAIARYGTPLYLFDLDEAARTVISLRKQTDGTAAVCYAMKANPFLTGTMAALADRIEVCSAGEYKICRFLGISPDRLLISGVLKERAELEEILEECRGACIYTVESPDQYRILSEWSGRREETLRVFLRLSGGNQFGMDMQTVKKLIEEGKKEKFLQIEGLHFFSGTQKRSSAVIREELLRLDRQILELEAECGTGLKVLEYGPGSAVPYFEGQEDRRSEDVELICGTIREMEWRGQVVLEMGRFLAAECGYYLTGVRDLKTNDRTRYCITDGGMHQINYDGQIRGMYVPHITVSPERPDGPEEDWVICGLLCTANDVLVGKAKLKAPRVGDVLIFHRAGAYAVTEGMALFLSHALPTVAVYSERTGLKLIREKQPTWIWNM